MTVVTLSNVAYAPGAYGPLFSLFSILKENEAKASFDSQRNGYTVQCKISKRLLRPRNERLYHLVAKNRDCISDKVVSIIIDVQDSVSKEKKNIQ